MLRALLTERFKLKFHRTDKEFSIYELSVAKGGAEAEGEYGRAGEPPQMVGRGVSGQKIEVPAQNAIDGRLCGDAAARDAGPADGE